MIACDPRHRQHHPLGSSRGFRAASPKTASARGGESIGRATERESVFRGGALDVGVRQRDSAPVRGRILDQGDVMNSRGVDCVVDPAVLQLGSTVLGEESKPPADPPASGRQPAARVLIDASKSNLPLGVRQNNVVIDLLRSKDYEVVVVRRGEAVSEQTLKGIDVAIRPRIFLPCSAEEIAAYRAAVSGGMRLLLFGQSRGYPDPVAEGLGLSFAESQRMGPVSRSVDHACTKDLSQLPSPWVEAEKTPPGTIALAWCGTDQAKSSPVMGVLPGWERCGRVYRHRVPKATTS